MKFIPSINIELNSATDFNYIVTENARMVAGNIASSFNSGYHSFSLIGNYGTGKSSFILAFEDDLYNGKNSIINRNIFSTTGGYEFLNIVGDYVSLKSLLASKLNCEEENVLENLSSFYNEIKRLNKILVIVIDEFGKILEFASQNNPEKEIYIIQKLAEFVNVPSRKIMLITTLHQNFGSYASKLSESQRNEWLKVKGRFQEIVFAEPVEQLLYLTIQHSTTRRILSKEEKNNYYSLYELGKNSKVLSKNFEIATAELLFPLDPISAICITLAIQRYGQNERSLFSFLNTKGQGSLIDFETKPNQTYSLAQVYDYLTYYFFSSINEMNSDTTGWRSIAIAVERVEGSNLPPKIIKECLKIVKTIGLLNIFFKGITVDHEFLEIYGKHALNIPDVKEIIGVLERLKVLRFAIYKSQFILYEGTDLNLENEIFKAASIIPLPTVTVDAIAPYINQKAMIASASYYKTGTPRFFEFRILNEPVVLEPEGEIDGFINLIFPLNDIEEEVKELSIVKNSTANIFCYFKNTEQIIKHLYEIDKINYVLDNIALDDRIATIELNNQKQYEARQLNEYVNSCLTSDSVCWYFRGERVKIESWRDINKLISRVSEFVYDKTPIVRNELFNRQKLSSSISLARVNLLDAMLANSDKEAFGIDGFPPEKTIYYTLFRESGIHRQDDSGQWILGSPLSKEMSSLWKVSEEFVLTSVDKPRKLTDLVKILRSAPFKLKQGVIDFWIPIFLFIKQQDFALYNGKTFVLQINKEIFELLQKRINDFYIKSFHITGIRLEFFKRYRQFLKKDDTISITTETLLATVKPFFYFYKNLNTYAKQTRKFDSVYTAKFRDILSNATDPVKTFFEDLPQAFGYKDLNSEDFIVQYIELIRNAVRELNLCYDNLLNRIENKIIQKLGLPESFESYKEILINRYRSIDSSILTPKARAFLNRILTHSETKAEFIEKISMVVSDKRLNDISDSEERILIFQILHLFGELERFSKLNFDQNTHDNSEAFNFEIASNRGFFSKSQTYRLPNNKIRQANEIIKKINCILTEDEDFNISILLKLLNQKIK